MHTGKIDRHITLYAMTTAQSQQATPWSGVSTLCDVWSFEILKKFYIAMDFRLAVWLLLFVNVCGGFNQDILNLYQRSFRGDVSIVFLPYSTLVHRSADLKG